MVDDATMDRLLYLSRIAVDSDERAEIAGQMGRIIDYFALLSKYDTSGVNIELGELVPSDALREDTARECFTPHQVKGFAVGFLDGYFSVPRILDEE